MRKFIDQKIVIASNNSGKVTEIEEMLRDFKLKILCNQSFKISEPIENGNTFKENAKIKASNTAFKTNLVSLSDDSGICFKSLNGQPGIHSARYAGKSKNFKYAMKKLNHELKSKKDKSCKFVCALSLCWPDGYNITVEGEVHGEFNWPPTGNNGFGYDPIFFYPELGKTFGEIDPFLKHSISHRYLAFNKLKNKIQKVVDA